MRARVVAFLLFTFFAVTQFESLKAQNQVWKPVPAAASSSTTSTGRIVVKLRQSFASVIEADMFARNSFSALAASDPTANPFLTQYGAGSMEPLYPGIVKSKLQQNLSWGQLADKTRQRYAARARRFTDTFNPPDISRTYVLQLNDSSPARVKLVLDSLKTDPRVEYAEEDKVMSIALTPNDPYFPSVGTWGQSYDDLWGLKKIGAPAAWDTATGAGVLVAVVDSGLDLTHPDIAGNFWTNTDEIPGNGIDDDGNGFIDDVNGWNFVSNTANPTDDHGHGTHVSGTIAAVGNNGIGVIGVAFQSKILPVKGLNAGGSGMSTWLANALVYAADNGADVINNSWGGSGSQTITDAVVYAHSLGAVVVAAAGNSGTDTNGFGPANIPEAIAVAATDPNDQLASFSNLGDKIDVAAPGVDILSLRAAGTTLGPIVGSQYTTASGTSMAAPHVSGVAALILSQHPTFSNEQVRQALRTSALDLGPTGFDTTFGYGRINSVAAIAVASPLEAKMTVPFPRSIVTQLTNIVGVARGIGFASYTLEYGFGTLPTTWTTIQTGATPVSASTLGTFDPALLPDGQYVMRLRVYDGVGNVYEDRLPIVVKCATIDFPVIPAALTAAGSLKPGASVSIQGSATGANFQSFTMDWARGYAPTGGWQTTGMTLSGGGTTAVEGSLLATWLVPSDLERDYYTIRLTEHRGGSVFESRTIVFMEPSLLSTWWPKSLPVGPKFGSGVVPVKTTGVGYYLAWAGNSYPAWLSISSPDGSSIYSPILQGTAGLYQPAAGDLNGDDSEEIEVGLNSIVTAFRPPTGSFFTNYPGLGLTGMNFYYSQVLVEDVDGDSQLEAIALQQSIPGSGQVAYIQAWRRDGQQLSAKFPVQIPDQNYEMIESRPRVLVGDVNGDGQKEFVALEGTTGYTFTPRLFSADGTPLSWGAGAVTGNAQEVALADLDRNGKLELVMIVNSPISNKTVHVLQPDGSERAGWPVTLLSSTDSLNSFIPAYLAIGDLQRDAHDEIVVSDGTAIYVLKADGTSLSSAWPLVIPTNSMGMKTVTGPIALADVTGSGTPSIVTTLSTVTANPLAANSAANKEVNADSLPVTAQYEDANGGPAVTQFYGLAVSSASPQFQLSLSVMDANATTLHSWNLQGERGIEPCMTGVVTVGDFDRDNITDIAVSYVSAVRRMNGSYSCSGPGIVTVLSTGTAFNAAANDWPMLNQNAHNTSVRQVARSATQVALTSSANPTVTGQQIVFTASVTAVAPATGTPTGSVTFYDGTTSIGTGTLNSSAQATLTISTLTQGSHSITASYAGDTNFNGSTSAAVSQTINAASFTMSGSASKTVNAGQSATYTISVAPDPPPFAFVVSGFTCTGLPRGTACTFNPTSITPASTTGTVDLTITTTARTTAALTPSGFGYSGFACWIGIGLVGLFVLPKRRRSSRKHLYVIAILACAALSSCGGGGGGTQPPPQNFGTPAGTYSITVSATSGTLNKTTTVTLVVN